MVDAFVELEAQYCPPLDPALLSAILSDYDLADQKSVEDARHTLDELKESAEVEEAAGFDAAGTGATDDNIAEEKRPESCPDTSASQSRETDASLSTGLSSLDLEDGHAGTNHGASEIEGAEALEKLDTATKIDLLQDLFGKHVNRFSIEYTLNKCDGRWNTAMEELLNHVYFNEDEDSQEETRILSKGVDGFSEDNTFRRGRKGKAKNKRLKNIDQQRSSSLPSSPGQTSASTPNKWKSASEDVEFIASRTRIPNATVSSVYYDKGASVPQTIGALLKASMEESKAIVSEDANVLSHARELGRDFPTIAPHYLTALIRLTHPSTVSAHELAKTLTAKPRDVDNGGIQIIPRYVAVDGMDPDMSWSTVSKAARSLASSRPSSLDEPSYSSRGDAYALARATAYSQASAAHRKAKSNPLMGGAAAHYGQVGREYAALASSARAAEADDLAAAQSSTNQLDLHGVDVLNAVRIAREKVGEWWDGLGESRVNGRIGAADRSMGYSIVVGLGRHSEGGKGKLGPAVTKMLRQEGWKVESAGAVIVVKGPMRN